MADVVLAQSGCGPEVVAILARVQLHRQLEAGEPGGKLALLVDVGAVRLARRVRRW